MVSVYLELLRDEVKSRPYKVLGNPRSAHGSLRKMGAIVGLGTGNVRSGAAIKFESAGIGGLFDTEAGGFGDDGDSRAQVLSSGVRQLDGTGELPVIIVGDTPHDVEAAHDIGAQCVGVPYRYNTADILKTAGADAIVDQVSGSLVPVIETLLRGAGR